MRYLEAKNDCPDKTKGQTRTAVDNIVRAHVFQMDTLISKELQGFVYVL
jgi:hypothetical protein